MYLFVDSEEAYYSFVSIEIDKKISIVEIELTDFSKSFRPDPSLGIAVALNKIHFDNESPVVVVTKREYTEIDDWNKLVAMKNVYCCFKPVTGDKAEAIIREIFPSG